MEEQQSPPEPDRNYPYPVDDEINLLDYLIVLLKHKWRIAYIVIIAGIIAVIYSVRLPNIYRSEATIVPRQEEKSESSTLAALRGLGGFAGELVGLGAGGSIEKFEVVLKSRVLAKRILSNHKNEILPVLYEEAWDSDNKVWISNPHPSIQDITNAIGGLLTIEKSGVLKFQVDYTNPYFTDMTL